MIGRTNAAGGGGIFGDQDAIVRVTAPAGSTVTFSRGTVTKSSTGHENADDSSIYDYYFVVPASAFSSNPWTVTGTLGASTDTYPVVVNDSREYDVELIYALFLLRKGVTQNGIALNGITITSGVTAPTITDMTGYKKIILPTNSGVYFDAVDFTSYSTLYVDSGIVDPNNYFSWLFEGIDDNTIWYSNSAGNMPAYTKFTTAYRRYTNQIDISGIGSAYKYMKLYSRATASAGFELDLFNVYVK